MKFGTSAALREWLLDHAGPRVLLAFSRGKDAIASWIALRDSGFEVIPYHMDLIPGLGFVDESIAYYERVFGAKIHRVSHPAFHRMLDGTMYQPPHDWHILNRLHKTLLKFEDVQDHMRSVIGEPRAFVALGVRAADSPMRRLVIKKHGPVNPSKRTVYPVFDWRVADIKLEMALARINLPVDYEMFGRSFDGIDYRYIKPIRERYPEDYKKIALWFPLVECEFKMREFANGH